MQGSDQEDHVEATYISIMGNNQEHHEGDKWTFPSWRKYWQLTWQNPGGAEVFMVGGVWSQRWKW